MRFLGLGLLAGIAVFVVIPCTGMAVAEASDGTDGSQTEPESIVFVDNGVLAAGRVRCIGGQLNEGDGHVEISGLNTHLVTNIGIGEGDLHVKAKLSIHGLARSAAAFKMSYVNSFGFEGSHGRVYLTGKLPSLELASLGRRTAEAEQELVRLMEESP